MLIASGLATLSACSERSEVADNAVAKAPAVIAHDSLGIQLVTVTAPTLDQLPPWRLSDEPLLSIGRRDGEDPYLLSRVAAARRLSSGEILIADGQSRQLRIFGPDGVFRRSYGRRGAGPGEFESFAYVSQTDGRQISVFDYPLARVTTIDLASGQYAITPLDGACREVSETGPRPCHPESLVTLADGTTFASVARPATPLPPTGSLVVRPGRIHRWGLLRNGMFQVVDSTSGPGQVVSDAYTSNIFMGPALFEPGDAVASGPDEVIFGDPHLFEIRTWGGSGRLRRVLRVRTSAVHVSAELLSVYRNWADTATASSAISREYINSLRPGGTVPFFDAIQIDSEGRVWLRSYRPFWAFGPTRDASWTIVGADGVPMARTVGDVPGEILDIGDDHVLVAETDELGVEYVRVYGLSPS